MLIMVIGWGIVTPVVAGALLHMVSVALVIVATLSISLCLVALRVTGGPELVHPLAPRERAALIALLGLLACTGVGYVVVSVVDHRGSAALGWAGFALAVVAGACGAVAHVRR
jgi:hypothetical protein